MCHEASGRALTAAIGTGKGTVDLYDFEQADAIWLFGDNAATNAPRMLTWLAEADRRGVELVHINPLIEAASRRTIVPHEFTFAIVRSPSIPSPLAVQRGRHCGMTAIGAWSSHA